MQRQSRLLVRTVCQHLRSQSPSVVFPSQLVSKSGCIRCLHLSHPQRSGEPTTSTSSAAQITETPLKIASASGSTPPPDEPDEPSHDHDLPFPEDNVPMPPRPIPSDSFARPPVRGRGRPRGSSTRRTMKSQPAQRNSLFKADIPEWFKARNVTLSEDLQRTMPDMVTPPENLEPSSNSSSIEPNSHGNAIKPRIAVSPYIRKELEAHLSAALLVRPGGSRENGAARKAHIHLQCPKRGAVYFLDEMIESAAKELEADMIRLDGQDLDELLESIIDPISPEMGFPQPQIFFTNIMRENSKDLEQKQETNSEEENEEIEEEEEEAESEFRLPPDIPMRLYRLFSQRPMFPTMINPSSSPFSTASRNSPSKEETDSKISTYLDLLISAPVEKRKRAMKKHQQPHGDSSTPQQTPRDSRTIIYLRDFQSILETPRGQIAHQTLLNLVHNRRRLGEKIVLVISDDMPADSMATAAFSTQYFHVIRIPPPTADTEKLALQQDRDARTREINLRNIQAAIRQRSRLPTMEFECLVGIHLDVAATSSITGLDDEIWDMNKVQRVASITLGNHGKWLSLHEPQHTVPISIANVAQAVDDLLKADQERIEKKQEHKAAREALETSEQGDELKRDAPKLSPINSKDCNKHEQKLLGGVIDPGKYAFGLF
jgi:hypothetical protein